MLALDRKQRISVLVTVTVAALVGALVLSLMTKPDAAAAPRQMVVCQDKNSDCMFYPKGGWKTVKTRNASGGTYHSSSSQKQPAIFLAGAGPTINFVTATGPKKGRALVRVVNLDNGTVAKQVTFNLRTKRPRYRVVRTIDGLRSDQVYGIAVVSLHGKPVAVDAVRSYLSMPPKPHAQGKPPAAPHS
jgi:hypothetical protein